MSHVSSKQRSIKNTVSIEGVGLHSGKPVHLNLHPAPINTGIVFRRADIQAEDLPLSFEHIVETPLCTKLVINGVCVQTIEHILSALAGLEIDNVIIEIDSDEIPIVDGSSAPFVFMIESAGIVEQEAVRKFIKILKTIRVEEEDKYAMVSSSDHFQVNVQIDFDHPAIKKTQQKIEFSFSTIAYAKEIARARTFGRADQMEALHKKGLALGAGLENAVGLSETGILNPEGLRVRDEFVKHKLLDVIGDLYTLGPIQGCYTAYKPSHALNHRLLKTLMSKPSSWIYVNA